MNRKLKVVSALVVGFGLVNPAVSLAIDFPSFPNFPGSGGSTTGTPTTANVLLECSLVASDTGVTVPTPGATGPSDSSSSCSSGSQDSSVSCSSSSASGDPTTRAIVPVLTFTAFHASANAPEGLTEDLVGVLDGNCAAAIAMVETDYAGDSAACSGPASFLGGLIFSCSLPGTDAE